MGYNKEGCGFGPHEWLLESSLKHHCFEITLRGQSTFLFEDVIR